jgi:hypothetical protein
LVLAKLVVLLVGHEAAVSPLADAPGDAVALAVFPDDTELVSVPAALEEPALLPQPARNRASTSTIQGVILRMIVELLERDRRTEIDVTRTAT